MYTKYIGFRFVEMNLRNWKTLAIVLIIVSTFLENGYAFTLTTKDDIEATLDNLTEWSSSDLDAVLSGIRNLIGIQNETLTQQTQYEAKLKLRVEMDAERESNRSQSLQREQEILKNLKNTVSIHLKKIFKTRKLRSSNTNEDYQRLSDCSDVFLNGEDTSGVYLVRTTWSSQSFPVYCDMDTDGGGWTVLHRFGSAAFEKDYFERTWEGYKFGFGDLETDFWIGNKHILDLTSQGQYEIRIDVTRKNIRTVEVYKTFYIHEEERDYRLRIGSYDNQRSNASDGNTFQKYDRNRFLTLDKMECRNDHRGWWKAHDCTPPLVYAESTYLEMKIRPTRFLKMSNL